MKTLWIILFVSFVAGMIWATDYGNIYTQTFPVQKLPNPMGNTSNPDKAQYQAAGWRYITVVDSPAPGYRVGSWLLVDIDGTNARQTVATSINIAQEAAEQAAAELAAKQMEAQLDNAQRIQKGVALVTMDELNIIRSWIASYKAEVASASSLADLKTRVAALPALPDRTESQIKVAVSNRVVNLP